LPWIFEKLVENRPNATNINLALSAERGVAKFVAVDHPSFGLDCTNGSLSHSTSHKELLDQAGCGYKEIEVELINWRDFILEQKITHVDLLVLDVEGHELSVIEGMQGCNVLPDVMCVEFGHLGLNTVRKKLELLGYIYDITSNANAYFIRKDKVGLFSFSIL
jgi:FkbM family methyltransferase